jgi:hypothetical protein
VPEPTTENLRLHVQRILANNARITYAEKVAAADRGQVIQTAEIHRRETVHEAGRLLLLLPLRCLVNACAASRTAPRRYGPAPGTLCTPLKAHELACFTRIHANGP